MNKSHVLVGITGGIAAYKTLELIRLAVKSGCQVRVVTSKNALHFVTETTLASLTGHRPIYDLFQQKAELMEHIDLGQWAHIFIVAPATANFLAKMAVGLADDAITTTLLALNPAAKIVIAPAMNSRMWQNPAVQANVARIKQLYGNNVKFVGPQEGLLACGEHGVGAMAPVEEIWNVAKKLLETNSSPASDLL